MTAPQIVVVSAKTARRVLTRYTGAHVEFIGRPSVLGSPFVLVEHGGSFTRAESIEHYEHWLRDCLFIKKRADVRAAMNKLWHLARRGPLVLQCHCAPLECHGDVIRQVLLETIATLDLRIAVPGPKRGTLSAMEVDDGEG